MVTPPDKEDHPETGSPNDSDAAPVGETEEKSADQETAEAAVDSATEAATERGEGDSTADPGSKSSARAKSAQVSGGARTAKTGAKRPARGSSGKGARSRAPGAAPPAARPAGGSLAKSVILFAVVVGGLAAAFAFLGRDEGGGRAAAPNWKIGQQVDVEITLVKTDINDLMCASTEEVAGRHCAQEAQTKKWSKPDEGDDDKKLLRPYTTTNGAELLAGGLWSEPAMKGTLPATRFTVKCKYAVEGKLKRPSIRWAMDKPWYESPGDWFSGVVSACTLVP